MDRKWGSASIRGQSIRLSFTYRGAKCQETLKIEPTKANLKFARRKLDMIRYEIEMGQFDYAEHFPNSRKLGAMKPGWNRKVGEQLDQWLRGHGPVLQYATQDDYRKIIEHHLKPKFGKLKLTELNKADIKEYMAELGKTLSAKRANNIMIPLRGMLSDAFEDELIGRNPAAKISYMKVPENEPDPFTPDEVSAILGACPEPEMRNYWRFAFATGLQTGEQMALEWDDVDWRKGTVMVRRSIVRGREKKELKAKGRRREVKLLPPALQALREQKAFTFLQGGKVFRNPKTGEPWRIVDEFRHRWGFTLKKAGVRYRRPYQTRHTYASTLLTAGEDPTWVAKQMGHANWAMIARVYGRWIDDMRPEAGGKAAAAMAESWYRTEVEKG